MGSATLLADQPGGTARDQSETVRTHQQGLPPGMAEAISLPQSPGDPRLLGRQASSPRQWKAGKSQANSQDCCSAPVTPGDEPGKSPASENRTVAGRPCGQTSLHTMSTPDHTGRLREPPMSILTKNKLAQAIAKAQKFGDDLDAKGAPPSPAEWRELQGLLDAVKSAKAENEDDADAARTKYTDAKAFMAALSGQAGGDGDRQGFLRIDGRAAKAAVSQRETKGLGSLVFPSTITTMPIAAGQPAASLLDIIPAVVLPGGARTFNYLRQTVRTNNAAPVAPGALKPTSVYTLVPITGEIRPIAHLSEPMNQYDLSDNAQLGQFLDSELRYGLALGVTSQVLAGTGVAPEIEGIGTVAGTQSQAWTTDRILTARAALTKLEVIGLAGAAFVLHPTDWEAIETAKATTGEFILDTSGAPIDRVQRKLWGVPVVLDVSITAGTGWLIAADSLVLVTDGQVRIEWATTADDFEKNLVRARCEGRYGLQINRPLGLVELDLTA